MASTWLTPPQIADRLGVSPDKVHAWIRSGELAACDLSERRGCRPRWRVDPADLDAFLSRRRAQPPAPRQRRLRTRPEVPEYV